MRTIQFWKFCVAAAVAVASGCFASCTEGVPYEVTLQNGAAGVTVSSEGGVRITVEK